MIDHGSDNIMVRSAVAFCQGMRNEAARLEKDLVAIGGVISAAIEDPEFRRVMAKFVAASADAHSCFADEVDSAFSPQRPSLVFRTNGTVERI